MVLTKCNVMLFSVSDVLDAVKEAGLNPDDILISPILEDKTRFHIGYYLIEKNDWKPLLFLPSTKKYARVINDTPNYAAGEKIYFETDMEVWYKLLWKKVMKNVNINRNSQSKS